VRLGEVTQDEQRSAFSKTRRLDAENHSADKQTICYERFTTSLSALFCPTALPASFSPNCCRFHATIMISCVFVQLGKERTCLNSGQRPKKTRLSTLNVFAIHRSDQPI